MNTIGRRFTLTVFGESHGELVGVVVDGVPPGVPFGPEDVQPALDRRHPGQSLLTTQRQEADQVRIRSGVFEGRTTGAPIVMEVLNEDKRCQDCLMHSGFEPSVIRGLSTFALIQPRVW